MGETSKLQLNSAALQGGVKGACGMSENTNTGFSSQASAVDTLAVNSDSMKITTHMFTSPKCSLLSQAEPADKVHELLCDRIR